MVAFELLDLFKFVTVPVLYDVVFACTKEVVAVAVLVVRDECHLHDTVLVCEEGLMAIAEVQTPEPYILVG